MITFKKIEKLEIDKDNIFRGECHDYSEEDVKSFLLDYLREDEEAKDFEELVDKLQYNGRISEYCDGLIPIYYADIAEWFIGNWSAVDDYVSEFGTDSVYMKNNGIMKMIQCAFGMTAERDFSSALEAFINKYFN